MMYSLSKKNNIPVTILIPWSICSRHMLRRYSYKKDDMKNRSWKSIKPSENTRSPTTHERVKPTAPSGPAHALRTGLPSTLKSFLSELETTAKDQMIRTRQRGVPAPCDGPLFVKSSSNTAAKRLNPRSTFLKSVDPVSLSNKTSCAFPTRPAQKEQTSTANKQKKTQPARPHALNKNIRVDASACETSGIDLASRESWPPRAPIVTIMGHVDHGKTTLLDTLRGTSVAKSEAGGITQHIGAFEVFLKHRNQTITFLDTPGHAAFENLRKRGAFVTDMVVLVVAADDGVMPQTVEAIKHAKAAGVPIIVALNKCDRKGVDLEKAKLSLMQHEIQIEEFGGDVMCVPISALKGTGIDHLEEAILTLGEVLDLRGDPKGSVEGVVVESSMKRGLGPVATVLVKQGTLRPGDLLSTGATGCRVRRLLNAKGETLPHAMPSMPVEVHGWKALPESGHPVMAASSLDDLSKKPAHRMHGLEAFSERVGYVSPGQAHHDDAATPFQTTTHIYIGVKGDVSGSVEALVAFLRRLNPPELTLHILFSGVGTFTESELTLASSATFSSSETLLLGLNVKVEKAVLQTIHQRQLVYLGSNVIYHLLQKVKDHLGTFLAPDISVEHLGEAQVVQLFSYQQAQTTLTVLGCKVVDGLLCLPGLVRVLRHRDEEPVWEGPIKSLRHFKKEVKKVAKGTDCGLVLDGFDKVQAGDIIQCIKKVEVPRTLD